MYSTWAKDTSDSSASCRPISIYMYRLMRGGHAYISQPWRNYVNHSAPAAFTRNARGTRRNHGDSGQAQVDEGPAGVTSEKVASCGLGEPDPELPAKPAGYARHRLRGMGASARAYSTCVKNWSASA